MELSQEYFKELAHKVLAQLPPEDRFLPEHGSALQANESLLLGWTEELVKVFYDSLFGHPETRAIFREGERPDREQTLRQWWERSVRGPFDDSYWAWQAYVGLIHVKRKVKNPMMLGHVALIERFICSKLQGPEHQAVREALSRLLATVASLIAQGYEDIYLKAIGEITGQEGKLLDRSVEIAVGSMPKLEIKS